MSHHIHKLKPILLELDAKVPCGQPVPVEALLPLFEHHSGKKIELIPVKSNLVRGIHLGTKDGRAFAVYKRCEVHHSTGEVVMACPGCQEARYDIAKELVHTFDGKGDKTPPDQAAAELIEHLVKEEFSENQQVFADGWGQWWGLELLVRYRHRVLIGGGGSLVLATARTTNDYSYMASQYCVPQDIVRKAYRPKYMDLMKGIREKHGLPCGIPDMDV